MKAPFQNKNSYLFKVLFLVPVFLIVFTNTAHAKKTKKDTLQSYQTINASYAFGGQIYNDNFIYNPGASFQASFGFKISKDLQVGIGTGYMSFEDENFIPIYFEVLGYKKKKKRNSPYIRMQMGYSLGWNDSFPSDINYEYNGGAFIDVGIGQKIPFNKKYAVLFQCSYRHQFASMEYDTYGTESYTQNLNYDMIVFTLGFMANNK